MITNLLCLSNVPTIKKEGIFALAANRPQVGTLIRTSKGVMTNMKHCYIVSALLLLSLFSFIYLFIYFT